MFTTSADAEADQRLVTRFGISLAGVNLLLGEGQSAEYLPQARVYPIPRVARRLRGATQVRGHPVLVFCGDLMPPEKLPLVQTCPIVLLTGTEPALALQVARPPTLLERVAAVPVDRPITGFAATLLRACRVRPLGSAVAAAIDDEFWWEIDQQGFFEALARE